MKFIEIKKGVLVNLDEVSVIKRGSDLKAEVIVDGKTLNSDLPYETLSKMIAKNERGKVKTESLFKSFLEQSGATTV